MRNNLNNLPRPVLQLPRQQSDLQTQTVPIPSTRPIQQSDLQTQTVPIPSTRPIQQSDLQTQTKLSTELPTQSIRTPFLRPLSPIIQTNRPPIKPLSLSPIPKSPPIKPLSLSPIPKSPPIETIQPPIETIQPPLSQVLQPQQNKSSTKKKSFKDFKLYYETEPYGTTTQYYIPVSKNIANPRITYSYPGNTHELGSNKRFNPLDVVDIAHYQDNTGNKQMTYTGDIGDIATALDEVEKPGKRNLTHLFTSSPTKSQQLPLQASQPAIERGYVSSLNNPVMSQTSMEKGYTSSLNNPAIQKQMTNIVKKTNEKEELKNKLGSTLSNPVIKERFNKMIDDNLNETKTPYEKTYALAKPYEQQRSWQEKIKDQAATPSISSYTPSIPSYTPSIPSYKPAVRPREQQSWQERIKKDQEMEKQVKDKELERLKNKASERRKKANKEYFGNGIVPPIYPSKMLVNLIKLLTRIYEGYASKEVANETKRFSKHSLQQ